MIDYELFQAVTWKGRVCDGLHSFLCGEPGIINQFGQSYR